MTCSTHFQVDHMISYLPLSHIAAQMMDIHAQLSTGLTIHFAQPDALKGSLKDTLKACHVTQSSLDSHVYVLYHMHGSGIIWVTCGIWLSCDAI